MPRLHPTVLLLLTSDLKSRHLNGLPVFRSNLLICKNGLLFTFLYYQCVVPCYSLKQNACNLTTLLINKHNVKLNIPLAIRSTLMARMIVGLMGINPDLISSRIIPIIDSMTIAISRRFQLQWQTQQYNGFQYRGLQMWRKSMIHVLVF